MRKVFMENYRHPILVIGIGNILLRDEGIGVRTIQRMQEIDVPDFVEIVDGSTTGIDLLDTLADGQKIIVVDAVNTAKKPGTIVKFSGMDILQPNNMKTSLHDLGIDQALHMTCLLKCPPKKVAVIGVCPKNISPGLELSKEIEKLIPRLIDLVIAEIHEPI